MRSLPFTGGDTELRQELEKLADPGYKTFHEGLIPGASMSYGVRLPDMRALAQKVLRGDPVSFLKGTHPASYEETMVRGLVVAGLKLPWEEKRPWVEDFLPASLGTGRRCGISCGPCTQTAGSITPGWPVWSSSPTLWTASTWRRASPFSSR